MLYKNLITFVLVTLINSAYTASLHDRRSDSNPDVKGGIKIASRESIDRESADISQSNTVDSKFDKLSGLSKADQAVDKLLLKRDNLKRQTSSKADLTDILNDIFVDGKVTPEGITGEIGVTGLAGLEGSVGLNGVSGSVGASTPGASTSTTAKEIKAGAAASDTSDSTGILGGESEEGKSLTSGTSNAASVGRIGALVILVLTISTAHNGW